MESGFFNLKKFAQPDVNRRHMQKNIWFTILSGGLWIGLFIFVELTFHSLQSQIFRVLFFLIISVDLLFIWKKYNQFLSSDVKTNGFSKISPNFQLYTGKVAPYSPGKGISVAEKSTPAFNILYMHPPVKSRIISIMGYELKATSTHIHNNLSDFLLKIAEMQQFIPACVQIEFKQLTGDSQSKVPYKIFTDNLENPLKTPLSGLDTEFRYHFFFTRSIAFPTKRNFMKLNRKMQIIANNLALLFTQNFPHYKFSLLKGKNLVNALQILPDKFSVKRLNSCRSQPKKRNFFDFQHHFIYFFIVCICLIAIFIGFNFSMTFFYWMVILVFGLKYLGHFCLSLYYLNFFYRQKNNHIDSLDLWKDKIIYVHKKRKTLAIHAVLESKTYFFNSYVWNQYFKGYRFNSSKFYRSIIQQFLPQNTSMALQYYFNRILPEDLKQYRSFLKNPKLISKADSQTLITTYERKASGFFQFYPILTIMYCKNEGFCFDHETLYSDQLAIIHQQIQDLFAVHFPNSDLQQANPKIFSQIIGKSKLTFPLQSPCRKFITTGKALQEFIQIPPEIHKYLPFYYAGEFSTPFLNDPITFGSSINMENFYEETQGGITMEEINRNLLFTGDIYEMTHLGLIRSVCELITHQLPILIFDWDGKWDRSALFLRQHHSQTNVHFLQVGDNCGFDLFDLPQPWQVDSRINYLNHIANLMGEIYHWNTSDKEILRSILLKTNEKNAKNTISVLNDHLTAANVSNSKGGSSLNLYKVPIFSFLSLLENGKLKDVFQREIESYISMQEFFKPNQVWIINLASLDNFNLKTLFIHGFLAQLMAFWMGTGSNHLKNGINPFISIIPHAEILFQTPKNRHPSTPSMEMFHSMNREGFPLILETNQISSMNEEIFTSLETIFAFQTNQQKNTRIIAEITHLDQQFVNIETSTQRKTSYQIQSLTRLDWNQSIVYRTQFSKPFVFQFDFNSLSQFYNETPRMHIANLIRKNPNELWPLMEKGEYQEDRKPIVDNLNQYDTLVELDFPEHRFIHEDFIHFLEMCKKQENSSKYLSSNQILENFQSQIIPRLKRNDYGEIRQNLFISSFINDLLEKQMYFTPCILKTQSTQELTEYSLSDYAKDVISNWYHAKPTRDENNGDVIFQGKDKTIINMDQNDDMRELSEEAHATLPVLNTPKNPQNLQEQRNFDPDYKANRKSPISRNPMLLKSPKNPIITQSSMQNYLEIQENLFDIIKTSRFKLNQENMLQILPTLRELWLKVLQSSSQDLDLSYFYDILEIQDIIDEPSEDISQIRDKLTTLENKLLLYPFPICSP